jgi:hypothetical protein
MKVAKILPKKKTIAMWLRIVVRSLPADVRWLPVIVRRYFFIVKLLRGIVRWLRTVVRSLPADVRWLFVIAR